MGIPNGAGNIMAVGNLSFSKLEGSDYDLSSIVVLFVDVSEQIGENILEFSTLLVL